MWLADLEMLRVHYAKTLEAWGRSVPGADARRLSLFSTPVFCRMWEFYLLLNVVAFRTPIAGGLSASIVEAH